jgi:cytochrome c553
MQSKSLAIGVALALTLAVVLAPTVSIAISETSEALDAALRLKPRLDHGAEIFDTCAACHGANGWGASDGSVPAIAGQSVPVLVQQVVEFQYDARHSIRMQHFTNRHHLATPQDVADVAAYVESLPPRQPAPLRQNPRSGQGASLFADFCASCHGRRAEGNPARRVPRLAAQHPEYLQEQLHDAAEGRRPSMGRDHARLLTPLSRDEIDAIAEYLAGLSPAPLGARRPSGAEALVPAATAFVELQARSRSARTSPIDDRSSKRRWP